MTKSMVDQQWPPMMDDLVRMAEAFEEEEDRESSYGNDTICMILWKRYCMYDSMERILCV